jgi:hypothetical protein
VCACVCAERDRKWNDSIFLPHKWQLSASKAMVIILGNELGSLTLISCSVSVIIPSTATQHMCGSVYKKRQTVLWKGVIVPKPHTFKNGLHEAYRYCITPYKRPEVTEIWNFLLLLHLSLWSSDITWRVYKLSCRNL